MYPHFVPVFIAESTLHWSARHGRSRNQPTETTPSTRKRRKLLLPITPYEDIYNVPNFLTFSRLLASPVIGYLVLHDQHAAALGLFAVAGLTDLVDGYLARRWKLQTVVGSVIDPMADKVLMTVLTVTLAVKGLLPGLHSTHSFCYLHVFSPFTSLLTEVRRFMCP